MHCLASLSLHCVQLLQSRELLTHMHTLLPMALLLSQICPVFVGRCPNATDTFSSHLRTYQPTSQRACASITTEPLCCYGTVDIPSGSSTSGATVLRHVSKWLCMEMWFCMKGTGWPSVDNELLAFCSWCSDPISVSPGNLVRWASCNPLCVMQYSD